MSLEFDIDKQKKISMMMETTGIDDINQLQGTFVIKVDGVKYGFPCNINEGKIDITIPSLRNIVKDIKAGKYDASLEIVGNKNFYLQPFCEQVILKQDPKLNVIVDDQDKSEMMEAITASISKILTEEDDGIDTKEDKEDDVSKNEPPTKKKTIMGGIFDR